VNPTGYKQHRKEQSIKEANQKRIRNLVLITLAILGLVVFLVYALQNKQSNSVDTTAETFELDKQPMIGLPNAPITLVEFGDFKCPVCKQFASAILPQLQKDYIDTGIVKMYFINYPFIAQDSKIAALATETVWAHKKEAAWPFIEAIYRNQEKEDTIWATPEKLVDIARKENLGIDYDKLLSDIKSAKQAAAVDADLSIVEKLNLTGTPSIFLNGKEVPLKTAFNYDEFKKLLDQAKGAK
jgi:protein-disulfide isomerase